MRSPPPEQRMIQHTKDPKHDTVYEVMHWAMDVFGPGTVLLMMTVGAYAIWKKKIKAFFDLDNGE